MNFSKSKYCNYKQCPKMAWLNKYRPELYVQDSAAEARFVNGNEVGDLAMGLFGDFVEVTVKDINGKINIPEMIENTKECIKNGVQNICEASFEYNGLYCVVDILRQDGDGYAIYEVKSSTHPENYAYIVDISYQKYVLEKCGLKINKTFTVTIDSSYVRGDDLDIKALFKITDLTDIVIKEQASVEATLKEAEEYLASREEPQKNISRACFEPYSCGYWQHCSAHLPTPSVFDLYRLSKAKKFEYYNMGIVSFDDIEKTGWFLSPQINNQVQYYLHDKGIYADKEGIKKFLDTLSYPLYFLDFETMQSIIPQFKGVSPYAQVPFQYSLHYIEEEGGELKHKEFLAQSGEDPRRTIAESLCENIPDNACCLAYNKSFECARLGELATLFPDLSIHLMAIRHNMKDLLDVFKGGLYYRKEIGGSFSIKSVLPAMFPNDPELDYHNLDGVHNGTEAMNVFPIIQFLPEEEQEIARHNLLKYCELDTYAMVKIWQELNNLVK